MSRGVTPRRKAAAGSGGASGPELMPCLLLRHGRVCRPGEHGPVVARKANGSEFDAFDVVDALRPNYPRVYLADLDGLERNDPQLEWVQELSRETTLWVDAGTRGADSAIDVLVAGAERAVLSSSYLQGPRELKRAWKLSEDLVFEIEMTEGGMAPADPAWGTNDPTSLASTVRSTGPQTVILSPRGEEPDWTLIAKLAESGPTWVDGSFSRADALVLTEAKAAGGIFHIEELLDSLGSA